MSLTFVNAGQDGVVYCATGDRAYAGFLYVDESLTVPAVGSALDCSFNDTGWGVGTSAPGFDGVTRKLTLCMGLTNGQSTKIYLPKIGGIRSATCWFQSSSAIAAARGRTVSNWPSQQTQVEFTIPAPTLQYAGNNRVSYDVSAVEAVSDGVEITYSDSSSADDRIYFAPPRPTALRITRTSNGFCTVLSDKWNRTTGQWRYCNCSTFSETSSACLSEDCLTGCPAPLAFTHCGQHYCRAYYYKQYADASSYCGWLNSTGSSVYCWALDEWVCKDSLCGHGGVNQPSNCSVLPPMTFDGAQALRWSCGHTTQTYNGQTWWTRSAAGDFTGCTDKPRNPNPQPIRIGGDLRITFLELPWLRSC